MRLGLVGRGPVGRFLARQLEPVDWTGSDLNLSADLDAVILAVPDAAIASCAQRVWRQAEPRALIHCSGATPLTALDPCPIQAVWHPMRPFPAGETVDSLECVVGLRGDGDWVRRLESWSRTWGGTPVTLAEDQALRVHLACCYAAGATALMTSLARAHFLAAGLEPAQAKGAIRGLSLPAMEAVLERGAQAITGPARRADHEVLDSHAQLQSSAEAELYRSMIEQLGAMGLIPEGEKIS